MNFEDQDHDLFEVFGEPDALVEDAPVEEIDLDDVRRDAIEADQTKPYAVKAAFSWAGFAGGLAALVWIVGAIGGPLSYFGVDAVMAMDPAMQVGLIALAFGPALLFWLGAAAAGEAMKTRSLATELTRLAHKARVPVEAGEAQAQRLSLTVKSEIEALNDAVATALNRLNELETIAQRNTALFDGAISATRENAQFMASQLEQERNALMSLNGDLRGQTEVMTHSISRQIRLMREASKLVKTEIVAAEDALETHLASFAASASLMGERTADFHQVADGATTATTQLNSTMASMLDGLGEATRLTDAARKSANDAVLAANETATAVRETTRSAVQDAKRAAQMIRSESQAMQEAAANTLSRLQGAAQAAREASEESQAAAERHATAIQKRLAALAGVAGAKKPVVVERTVERKPEAVIERVKEPVAAEAGLYAAAAAATRARPQVRAHAETVATGEPPRRGIFSFAWAGSTSPRDENPTSGHDTAPANDSCDLVEFRPKPQTDDATLKAGAVDLVFVAGVDLDHALAPAALEIVAQRSRDGAAARRKAVADLAPNAVSRIARHLQRDAAAKALATRFRARPDLAKSEKKAESSDLVRAYLLIDAALA